MNARKRWLWIGQGVLAILLAVFVGRSLVANWNRFPRDVQLDVHVGRIVLAAAVVLVTYGLLIAAWRSILVAWGHVLPYRTAARIWCISNLGRYVPGKVWSIAGLAVLAKNAGVEGTAAAAAAVAMQVLAIGTGAAVVAIGAPGAASPTGILLAIVVAALFVGLLVWKRAMHRLAALAQSAVTLTPLPPSAAFLAAAITLASWITYGFAFWLLGEGLLAQTMPPWGTTVGIFAAGYIVGLLALFAPGGIGVRELVHVALLGPLVGNGGALAVSIAARLLLTFTEIGAAVVTLAIGRQGRPS